MSEVDDLWVVGIGSGRKPGMFQPFPKTTYKLKLNRRWGYADFSLEELTCWRSHPSEADLQAFKRYEQNWRLFFKAYIGVDFYETKPTFCAIFHV